MSGERSDAIFAILKLGNRVPRVKISPQYNIFWSKRLWGSFMLVQKLLKMNKFYKIDSKKIYWRKVYKFTPQRAYRPWVTPGLKPSQTEIKFTTQPNLFLCPTFNFALYGWIWRIYSVSARLNIRHNNTFLPISQKFLKILKKSFGEFFGKNTLRKYSFKLG